MAQKARSRQSPTKKTERISAAIVRVVHETGGASRAQVARVLDVSPSTVGRIANALIAEGTIVEIGPSLTKRSGRPSTYLRLNPGVGSVIALDLRLTEAYAVRADFDGNVLARVVRPLPLTQGTASVPEVIALLRELIAKGPSVPPLHAIVVGAPSIVNAATGEVEWAPSLGWKNLQLGKMLKEALGVHVLIENDANLAALGEFWKGVARGARDVVFVSVGTGVGAGILLDGRLHHGSTHAAGEVAYFVSDINAILDDAGRIGSLEMRVARDGILRLATLLAQRYPASRLAELISRVGLELRAQDVFSLALEGDPAAQVVFAEAVDLLSIVICNLSVVLDPEVVVLGGPSDWKWPSLVAAIQKRIGSALLRSVPLRPTALGRDAVVLGAVYLALEANSALPGGSLSGGGNASTAR